MNRYEFVLRLANGDEVHARSVGTTEKDALARLQQQEAYKAFVANTYVRHIRLLREYPADLANPDKFYLAPSQEKEHWWVCADRERNVVVQWREGAYSETSKATPINDDDAPIDIATSLRQIGEFLMQNYPDLI